MTAPTADETRAWIRRVVTAALIAAATALAFVHEARGQSAAINATVLVDPTALAIGQLRSLLFGNVTPGTPVTVDGRNASAGQFEVQGTRNAEVAITMTLPTQLSTGFWTMPISFGPTSGCWRRQTGQNACTYWDPNTVLVQRVRNNPVPNNHLWVWIGGTVSPAAAQHSGVYTASIGLTVVYTGN